MTARQSVIPADKLDLLDSTALAQVATVVPAGEPQVNPGAVLKTMCRW